MIPHWNLLGYFTHFSFKSNRFCCNSIPDHHIVLRFAHVSTYGMFDQLPSHRANNVESIYMTSYNSFAWSIVNASLVFKLILCIKHIGGLVQERHNSIANALELCLSCTNPSMLNASLVPRVRCACDVIQFWLDSFRKYQRPTEMGGDPLGDIVLGNP